MSVEEVVEVMVVVAVTLRERGKVKASGTSDGSRGETGGSKVLVVEGGGSDVCRR